MEYTTLPPLTEIQFSYNWNNKLKCKSFTTVRIENHRKYLIGQEYYIRLNKEIISKAKIRMISRLNLESINDFISFLDTGYSVDEFKSIMKKIYPKINFSHTYLYLILLENLERIESKYDPDGISCTEYFECTPWKV